jgi:NAD+--asparagine ADP-ribosyltransferase
MTEEERALRIGKLNLERAEARKKLGEVGVISRDLANKFSELAAALDPHPSRGHASAEWLVSNLKPELAQFIVGDKLLDLVKNKTALEDIVGRCSRELVALQVEEEPDPVSEIGRRP